MSLCLIDDLSVALICFYLAVCLSFCLSSSFFFYFSITLSCMFVIIFVCRLFVCSLSVRLCRSVGRYYCLFFHPFVCPLACPSLQFDDLQVGMSFCLSVGIFFFSACLSICWYVRWSVLGRLYLFCQWVSLANAQVFMKTNVIKIIVVQLK